MLKLFLMKLGYIMSNSVEYVSDIAVVSELVSFNI